MIQKEEERLTLALESEQNESESQKDLMDSIILDFILKNVKTQNLPLKRFMNQFEERIIKTSLKISNGNQRIAAGLLGVGPTTLNEKIKKFKIHRKYVKTDPMENIQRDFNGLIDIEKYN